LISWTTSLRIKEKSGSSNTADSLFPKRDREATSYDKHVGANWIPQETAWIYKGIPGERALESSPNNRDIFLKITMIRNPIRKVSYSNSWINSVRASLGARPQIWKESTKLPRRSKDTKQEIHKMLNAITIDIKIKIEFI